LISETIASGLPRRALIQRIGGRWYNCAMAPRFGQVCRGRFRFGLRSLLVVVTLACVWLGWNANVVHQRRAMLADVESRGGRIIVGYALFQGSELVSADPSSWRAPRSFSSLTMLPGDQNLSWIRALLGDRTIAVIYLPSGEFADDDAQRIQAAFPEALLLPGPFGMQSMAETRTGDAR
jgi:hypothetical protein